MSNDQIKKALSEISVTYNVFEIESRYVKNKIVTVLTETATCSTEEQAEVFILTAIRLSTFKNPLTIIKQYEQKN